jgi:lysozyme family protein
MTAANFDRALTLVLKHEGGYVDHPKDPGGATNLGITLATLTVWRKRTVSKDDVRALTREEAAAIYRKNYWAKVKGDDLPSGVDYATFDFAVNSGVGRAARFLQETLKIAADGKIGPQTLAACYGASAPGLIAALCDRRLAWLKTLSTWSTFGKGWGARVAGVRKDALAMVEKPAPAPEAPQKPAEAVPVPPMPLPPDIPKPEPAPAPESLWTRFLRFLGFRPH